MSVQDSQSRRLRLPLFALLELPVGVQAAVYTVLPYFVLRSKGLGMEQITALMAFCSLPATFYFLYAPITDFFMPRRVWLMVTAGVSAALTAMAILASERPHPSQLRALLFAATVANVLVNSANGGLMSSLLHSEQRARVGTWVQIGSLGGGSLAFTLFVYLATSTNMAVLATVSCLLTVLPAVPALLLKEPERKAGTYLGSLLQTKQEFQSTFLKQGNLPGLLLLLSPIGTGQVANVLTGLTEQYHASAGELSFANGWGAGITTACGALLMLLVPARWDRRSVYAAAGLVYASASLVLASGPLRPMTFVVGMLASNFAQGFCWSALTGLILSLMGTPGRSESSRYALLGSLFFASTTYMVWLDGRVIQTYGPRSLGLFDAAANIASAALFFLWWICARRFRPQAAA